MYYIYLWKNVQEIHWLNFQSVVNIDFYPGKCHFYIGKILMCQKIILYHGSQFIIKKPVYGEGNPKNDYGLGFYCTQEIEIANEWACTEKENGYANKYELDISNLSVMRLNGTDYNILNWIAILLNNRSFQISNEIAEEGKKFLLSRFLPDIDNTDIIVGYRANDSYFSFANAFLNNTLSLNQLKKAMHLDNSGEQTVLKSKNAFEQIQFIESLPAEKEIYFPKRYTRDNEARNAHRTERKTQPVTDSIYLIDILRENWSNDNARLR